MSAGPAFDWMAEDYDRTFTDTPIGRCLRNAVWRRLDAVYPRGASVLEVNCGTGEDAIHLASRGVHVLATNAAPAMVEVARRKVESADLEGRVRVEHVAIEDVGPHLGSFDGVVSNFGGLNCVADLRCAAVALAGCVRPGGTAVLCLMGPAVPWEWAWYLARGEPARAFRRFRGGEFRVFVQDSSFLAVVPPGLVTGNLWLPHNSFSLLQVAEPRSSSPTTCRSPAP